MRCRRYFKRITLPYVVKGICKELDRRNKKVTTDDSFTPSCIDSTNYSYTTAEYEFSWTYT